MRKLFVTFFVCMTVQPIFAATDLTVIGPQGSEKFKISKAWSEPASPDGPKVVIVVLNWNGDDTETSQTPGFLSYQTQSAADALVIADLVSKSETVTCHASTFVQVGSNPQLMTCDSLTLR